METKEAYSAAADRNKDAILEVLKEYIQDDKRLLEIGSGSAQHAVHFASHFHEVAWVTSDVIENHPAIQARLKDAHIKNLHGPEKLKVGVDDFPQGAFNYVFTANTLHIMTWKENKSLFKLLSKRLREGSMVFIYGPFNYGGDFTSPSNKEFDDFLKTQNVKSGIRNFEDVEKIMTAGGFKLVKDHEMPANNRLLVFRRLAFQKSL
jgi:cyclopropane fatty-acyl-phospholipid synthase-like methyltransferase